MLIGHLCNLLLEISVDIHCSFIFKIIILLLYVYGCFVCMYVAVLHVHAWGLWRSELRVLSSGARNRWVFCKSSKCSDEFFVFFFFYSVTQSSNSWTSSSAFPVLRLQAWTTMSDFLQLFLSILHLILYLLDLRRGVGCEWKIPIGIIINGR